MKIPALVLVLGMATAPGFAVTSGANDDAHYTAAQIRQMIRTAHTQEQFGELADYYQVQRRMFQRKAAEEEHEWARRSAVLTPLAEKWPRPVDSSRSRYEYFEQEAAWAASRSAHFSKLADEAAGR